MSFSCSWFHWEDVSGVSLEEVILASSISVAGASLEDIPSTSMVCGY